MSTRNLHICYMIEKSLDKTLYDSYMNNRNRIFVEETFVKFFSVKKKRGPKELTTTPLHALKRV